MAGISIRYFAQSDTFVGSLDSSAFDEGQRAFAPTRSSPCWYRLVLKQDVEIEIRQRVAIRFGAVRHRNGVPPGEQLSLVFATRLLAITVNDGSALPQRMEAAHSSPVMTANSEGPMSAAPVDQPIITTADPVEVVATDEERRTQRLYDAAMNVASLESALGLLDLL